MSYRGSCHCGKIAYEVQGTPEQVIDCNCSHCSRKGYLLWFVDRDQLRIDTPEDQLATYTFNKHSIKHHFCPACGCAPFGMAADKSGAQKAAINVRCLEDIDLKTLQVIPVDGKSF